MQALGMSSLLSVGARAYERLGDDPAAAATAALAATCQKKQAVVADCACTAGRVAGRAGDAAAAGEHFKEAQAQAAKARSWGQVLVANKQWNDACSGTDGQVEAVKQAVAAMGKDEQYIRSVDVWQL